MSGWLIGTIIVGIIALIAIGLAVFVHRALKNDPDEGPTLWGTKILAGVLTFVTLLLLLLSSTQVVPTKTVGVVTSFGRPVGVLSNGLHWIAPWQKVVEFDASIQTTKHTGKSGCTTVRIYNQATACVDNSLRWRIKQHAAPALYRDYKSFDNMRDSLVNRELQTVLNQVFSTYDPLKAVEQKDAAQPEFSLGKLGQQATDMMRQRVGNQVEIQSLVIPYVRFEKSTEEKIDGYQAALADTRIAEQKKATSQREAEANAARKGELNDNTLKAQCLDVVREAVREGKQLPAGFSCMGPGSVVVGK